MAAALIQFDENFAQDLLSKNYVLLRLLIKCGSYKSAATNTVFTVCQKDFSKRGLMWHLQTNHVTKTYECDICELKFFTMSALGGHVRTIHNQRKKQYTEMRKNHECYRCNKEFSKISSLKQHLKKHRKNG